MCREFCKEKLREEQCDHIGQFITLWATFQSLFQQLFCPNCQHILGKCFLGNFYRQLATFYWSHWQTKNIYNYGPKVTFEPSPSLSN